MMIKTILFVALCGTVLAQNNKVNKANVALEVHRVARSPQQNNFPNFSNFTNFPNFPAPPGFDNSHIVAQDTDVNKNGFAQSTIYKSDHGMGSSSVSFSPSVPKSAATTITTASSAVLVLLAVVSAIFLRH